MNIKYYNIHFENGDIKRLVHENDIAVIKEALQEDRGFGIFIGDDDLEYVNLELIAFIVPSNDDREL